MPIEVMSRRRSAATIEKQYPNSTVIDVTSRAAQPWVQLSPFYPHGGIPVPGSPGTFGQSVEGIWQALKVFETSDVDLSKLDVTSMKGLKRTTRRYGRVLGHRYGSTGQVLLPYGPARRRIYLPAYRWVLEHRVKDLLDELAELSRRADVVLLDYETNLDVDDLSRPLSHAGLVRLHLEDRWPAEPPDVPADPE
ncbi:hypothetical protein AB0J86_12000 [Micromonospora sp. NPDC049559]|uniref:DUF6939 family protein n=1 Tax=Micromonospora sp. NPDC049559 TaxID=3155923 RepID=UPI0034235E4F